MNIPIGRSSMLGRYYSVSDVAERLMPDAPLLCFSPEKLANKSKTFIKDFPGETAYAVKANPHGRVIETLSQNGIGTFDVASPAEMEIVHYHAPEAKLHYHNPVKSREEIAFAFRRYGCRRFAIDDLSELRKIDAVLPAGEKIEIAIRLRLEASTGAAHDFSTKFGAAAEEVPGLLQEVERLGFTAILTFHPGSQCVDVGGWLQGIRLAAKLAKQSNVRLEKLNIGGGFPARYGGNYTPSIVKMFDAIDTTVRDAFGCDYPETECEPGRALVADSMDLLARVKTVRRDKRELFINDGIYGSLLESNQAPTLMPRHRALASVENLELFTVFGPTCDPLDRLLHPLALPIDIAEGDYIEFLGVGAYAGATATQFNGYGASAVVEIDHFTKLQY